MPKSTTEKPAKKDDEAVDRIPDLDVETAVYQLRGVSAILRAYATAASEGAVLDERDAIAFDLIAEDLERLHAVIEKEVYRFMDQID